MPRGLRAYRRDWIKELKAGRSTDSSAAMLCQHCEDKAALLMFRCVQRLAIGRSCLSEGARLLQHGVQISLDIILPYPPSEDGRSVEILLVATRRIRSSSGTYFIRPSRFSFTFRLSCPSPFTPRPSYSRPACALVICTWAARSCLTS